MARPTKFTKAIQTRITKALSLGATKDLAARAGGVSYETLRRWLRAGELGDEPYCALCVAVRRSEGEAAQRWLGVIEEAALSGEWRAAAWKLERRYPDDYGRKSRGDSQADAAPGGGVLVVPATLTPTEWVKKYGRPKTEV